MCGVIEGFGTWTHLDFLFLSQLVGIHTEGEYLRYSMKYATVASTLSRYYGLCLLNPFFCLSLSSPITDQDISSPPSLPIPCSFHSLFYQSRLSCNIKMEMMDRQSIWKWYTGVPTHCAQGTWTSLVLICGSAAQQFILDANICAVVWLWCIHQL